MQKHILAFAGLAAGFLFVPVIAEAAPITVPLLPYFTQETSPETMTAPVTGTVPEAAPAPHTVQAQAKATDPEADTLMGDGNIASGGYGGPGIKFGRIAGNDAVFVGGRGGWIIDHQFVIGGGGYGMASNVEAPRGTRSPYALSNRIEERLNMGYGGFMMEYFILPKKVVHATVGILIGGGSVSVNEYYPDRMGGEENNNEMMDGPADSFFIAEPEVHAELNIVRFLRADLGASYRIVTGVNGIGLENKDLRGPSASLLLRFGYF